MRAKLGWGLVWGALAMSCVAGHSRKASAGNCALYARAITGVGLHGAAGGWWYQAAGRYQRGHAPLTGSILVFRPTRTMPSGHVAVVAEVVGPSMVLVDQSNWYHGRVTLATPVIDTSPNHDWTEVAVMNIGSGQFGRDNPTFGFVYAQAEPGLFAVTAPTGPAGRMAPVPIAYDTSRPSPVAIATSDDDDPLYVSARRHLRHRSGHRPLVVRASFRTHRHKLSRSHSRGRHMLHLAAHWPQLQSAKPSAHLHSYRLAASG